MSRLSIVLTTCFLAVAALLLALDANPVVEVTSAVVQAEPLVRLSPRKRLSVFGPATTSEAPKVETFNAGPVSLKTTVGSSGTTRVEVTGVGAKMSSVFSLQNPSRFVIDFSGTKLRTNDSKILSRSGAVKQVRLGKHPEATRVVLDLAGDFKYTFKGTPDKVVVEFSL